MIPTRFIDGYSPIIARSLAEAAEVAYDLVTPAEDIKKRYNLVTFVRIDDAKTDTHCFVASTNSQILVAFRGTASRHNWITDLTVRRIKLLWAGRFIKVHEGFHTALESVYDKIIEEIEKISGDANKIIYVTGHSLGGALALLFVAFCGWKHERCAKDTVALYTFGQPKVGNYWFARKFNRWFKNITWRVIDQEDIIARVPTLLGLFWHSGQTAFYNSFGKLHINMPAFWRLPSDINGIVRELVKRLGFAVIRDHFIAVYREVLAGKVWKRTSSRMVS
jgi:triacylglycerol lipase